MKLIYERSQAGRRASSLPSHGDLPSVDQVVFADLHAGRAPTEQLLMEISQAYVDPLDHQ